MKQLILMLKLRVIIILNFDNFGSDNNDDNSDSIIKLSKTQTYTFLSSLYQQKTIKNYSNP